MKGVIASCIKKMVIRQSGEKAWNSILKYAGIKAVFKTLANENIDDHVIM